MNLIKTALASLVLTLAGAAQASPMLTALGGGQYNVSFDPTTYTISTAGGVAAVVFQDFFVNNGASCGSFVSGTVASSRNGGPTLQLNGNACTGAYNALNDVHRNDLLVTMYSGFSSTYGNVSVGDQFTMSATNYHFTLSGLAPAARSGPFNTYLVNNSFARVSGVVAATQVPEPTTLALAGLGLLGFAATRRRKSVAAA